VLGYAGKGESKIMFSMYEMALYRLGSRAGNDSPDMKEAEEPSEGGFSLKLGRGMKALLHWDEILWPFFSLFYNLVDVGRDGFTTT
jgi:hypothetical protein